VQAANYLRRRAGVAMGAPTLFDPVGELGRRPQRNPGPPPIPRLYSAIVIFPLEYGAGFPYSALKNIKIHLTFD